MKRSMKAILMMLVLLFTMSSTALAEKGDMLGAGFCAIGKESDVTIQACTAAGETVGSVSATPVDGGDAVKFYEGAERLTVTYTGAATAGDQFMVLLVTGSDLPTAANTICYIDQVAMEDGAIVFDVYPMLPEVTTEMTLFITSNKENFTTLQIPLTYAAAGEYINAGYTQGDVDGSGSVDIFDATAIINHIIYRERLSGDPLKAADANSDGFVNVNDVMEILNFIVEN